MSRLVFLTVLSTLVLAGSAHAGTLTYAGGVVTYTAAPGEANFVNVNWGNNPGAGPPTFTDHVDIVPGPGCEEVFSFSYACPAAGDRPDVVMRLGDGDDLGESINDEAAGEHAEIYGEDGKDQLRSGAGSDLLDGGAGDDTLTPDDDDQGPGDVVIGGEGKDLLQLASVLVPTLTATLDGVADDGGPGEKDDYRADIEDVQGSRVAANRIVGTAGPNHLYIFQDSNLGDDVSGGGGNDLIETQDGNDKLDGGDGDDTLIGGAGDDNLTGGAGKDAFDGDGETGDFSFDGNDVINARDGVAETVNCGGGADTAVLDHSDLIPSDPGSLCESVDRAAAAAKPALGGKGKLRLRDGRIAITVRCAAACKGSVRIRTLGGLAVGSKAFAKGGTVRVKASKKARGVLRREGSLRVRVELRVSGATVASAKKTLR